MANLQGISGIQIGDGNSGKIALAIKTGVLRILYDNKNMAYRTATILNKGEIKTGSVSYQVPEIVKAEDYGTGTSQFQTLQSGLVTIPINIRRTVKFTYETFDASRLGEMEYVIGVITNSMAVTIENDLNAHFWRFLDENFKETSGTLRAQHIVLPNLESETATQDEIRADLYKLQRKAVQISKTYDKRHMGIDKAELMVYLDPMCDVNIRQAYWNQPNSLGERVISKNLVGKQLGGGIYYYLDNMLGTNIAADASFSKDKALDMSAYVGFIIHNEAIAMPFNLQQIGQITDQDNLNIRTIAKYQFGIGFLRPNLVYSITKKAVSRGR